MQQQGSSQLQAHLLKHAAAAEDDSSLHMHVSTRVSTAAASSLEHTLKGKAASSIVMACLRLVLETKFPVWTCVTSCVQRLALPAIKIDEAQWLHAGTYDRWSR